MRSVFFASSNLSVDSDPPRAGYQSTGIWCRVGCPTPFSSQDIRRIVRVGARSDRSQAPPCDSQSSRSQPSAPPRTRIKSKWRAYAARQSANSGRDRTDRPRTDRGATAVLPRRRARTRPRRRVSATVPSRSRLGVVAPSSPLPRGVVAADPRRRRRGGIAAAASRRRRGDLAAASRRPRGLDRGRAQVLRRGPVTRVPGLCAGADGGTAAGGGRRWNRGL